MDDASASDSADAAGYRDRARCSWLTVLHHPDGQRVGESVAMEELSAGLPVALSRTRPLFAAASGERRPLDHLRVSRAPIWLQVQDQALSITCESTKARVMVQDQPLRQRRSIAWSEVRERGVLIALGGNVLVWLHERANAPTLLDDDGILGVEPATDLVRTAVARVAAVPVPVLILGESGVGKELVARALHRRGPRGHGPWVAVNLAAVPTTTAADALFGHKRGAFTGAEQTRPGFFVEADGGTLFLDEIGELASEVQPLLLRVLENREIQPVGGSIRTVDVRVIAATDADLNPLVAGGRFRRALLHRLQSAVIEVPPLRARRADVPLLLHHFLRIQLRELDAEHLLDESADAPRERPWLRSSVVTKLMRHDFPGNVRELRNIAVAMALAGHDGTRARLPAWLTRAEVEDESVIESTGTGEKSGPGKELTPELLQETLREHAFNITRSARALGISKNTLSTRIRETPGLRLAGELSRADIEEARARVGADIDQMAAALQVSVHGLRLRLRELRA